MNLIHKNLSSRWHCFTLPMQMANIGSELHRAIKFQKNGDKKDAKDAFERTIELIDFTIADKRYKKRSRELTIFREAVAGLYADNNQYKISSELIENYFLNFAMYAGT